LGRLRHNTGLLRRDLRSSTGICRSADVIASDSRTPQFVSKSFSF
jgi:hypothetical protein